MPNAPVETRRWPIIRVFVSSTFGDLKLERDTLQQRVFPKLEQRCLRRGFQFQAIDLRWGVSTEAALNHQTMRICFEELRRSQHISPRPNFLILLGNRYGWRPLPEMISMEQYQKLVSAATALDRDGGSRALETLEHWYCRDENQLPPAYELRSRIGTDGTGAGANWPSVEATLWEVINRAYEPRAMNAGRFQQPAMPLEDRFGQPAFPEIVRFQASATEQEIWGGALSVEHADQHVLACFRDLRNLADLYGRDGQAGAFDADRIQDFVSVSDHRIDVRLGDLQEQLKSEIMRRLDAHAAIPSRPSNVFLLQGAELQETTNDRGVARYSIAKSDEYSPSLQQMCAWVEQRFAAIIDQQIDDYVRGAGAPSVEATPPAAQPSLARALAIERQEHERFAAERGAASSFTGREDELRRIVDYALGRDPTGSGQPHAPLVVYGASGCGKTALVARAAQAIAAELRQTGGGAPIVRFIGATPRSSDLRLLLGDLCQEFRDRDPLEVELPTDANELRDEFQARLRSAAPNEPLVLLLDALDQLFDSNQGRQLNWLPPGPLPSSVRLVVSCLSDRTPEQGGHEPLAELERRKSLPETVRIPADNFIPVSPLSRADAVRLIERWLELADRRISSDQRAIVEQRLEAQECRQPLYLKLLFEEVRRWRSYDADSRLEPPTGTGGYFGARLTALFARLSLPENHGRMLVRRVLGYLAAARHGLSESEILEVLFADHEIREQLEATSRDNRHELPTATRRIPIAIWSRLRSDLAPYLTERTAVGGNVLSLYHRQIAEWVLEHYVVETGIDWNPRERLAAYFDRQELFGESLADQQVRASQFPPTPRPTNLRKIDELPWLRRTAGQWDQLEQVLTSLDFLEAYAEAGLVHELSQELSAAVAALPTNRPLHRILRLLHEALVHDLRFVARHPTTLFQCWWNRCWWYDSPEAADYFDAGKSYWPAPGPPWQCSGPKLHQQLEAWRREKETRTPRFRWLRSLRPPEMMLGAGQLRLYEGHQGRVSALACFPHSSQLASAGEDATIRIWSTETGRALACLRGHSLPITGLAVTRCEQWIVSSSLDGTVRVWNVQTGQQELTLREPTGDQASYSSSMNCLAISPDGRWIAAAGNDEHTRIWEVADWSLKTQCRHEFHVQAVAFSPNGETLFCGSSGRVLAWETQTGRLLYAQRSLRETVRQVAISPDGVWGASCSRDSNCAHLWKVSNGRPVRFFAGHATGLTACCFGPRSQRLYTSSQDHTVAAWNVETGEQLSSLQLPVTPSCLTLTANGKSLLCGMADGRIREVPIADELARPQLDTHLAPLTDVAFSSDGRFIATTAMESSVRVWDGTNGRPIHHLLGHAAECTRARFAPDDRLLSTQEQSGNTFRLWDAQSGFPLAFLVLPQGLTVLGFSQRDFLLLGSVEKPKLTSQNEMPASDEAIEPSAEPLPPGWYALDAFTGQGVSYHPTHTVMPLHEPSAMARPKPFVARSDEEETTLLVSCSRDVVGWFPESPHRNGSTGEWATPGNATIWAAGSGWHLHLFCLEGEGANLSGASRRPPDTDGRFSDEWVNRLSPVSVYIAQRGAGTLERVLEQSRHEDPAYRRDAVAALTGAALSPAELATVMPEPSLSLLDDTGRTMNGMNVDGVFSDILVIQMGGRMVPALIDGLADPSPKRQRDSLRLLRGVGPAAKRAIPVVLEKLLAGNLEPRHALGMLVHVGIDATMPVAALANSLRLEYDSGSDADLQNLYDSLWREAWEALDQLADDEPPAVLAPILPTILCGIRVGSAEHRRRAARVLGKLGPAAIAAAADLQHALESDDRDLRRVVAWSLSRILPPDEQAYMQIAQMNSDDSTQRNAGAHYFTLEDRDASIGLPVLARLVQEDGDHSVRYHSALALGHVRGEAVDRALAALTQSLADSNPYVREAAEESLATLRPAPPEPTSLEPVSISGIKLFRFEPEDDAVDPSESGEQEFDEEPEDELVEDLFDWPVSDDLADEDDLPVAAVDKTAAKENARGDRRAGLIGLVTGQCFFIGGLVLSYILWPWGVLLGVPLALVGGALVATAGLVLLGKLQSTVCPTCGSRATSLGGIVTCRTCQAKANRT